MSSPIDKAKESAEDLKQQIPSADSLKSQIPSTSDLKQQIPSTDELKDKIPSQEDMAEAAKKSVSSLRDFVAGGVGGVCAVVVGHPFDLVKVRLQTAEKGVYNGAMDVVRKTIAREGLGRGLYAGVSAPLVGVTPMCEFTLVPIVSRVKRARN